MGGLWRRIQPMVVGGVIGLGGSCLFLLLKLPLPWFLGALTASLVMAVLGVPFAGPKPIQTPVRIVLGVAVGTAFTPALMARAPAMAASLAAMLPWIVLIMGAGTWGLRRFAGLDGRTALFASVPGGLTDMVTLAESTGANVRTVTLIQLTRIALIVFLIPVWLIWHDHLDIAGRASSGRVGLLESSLLDLVVLIAFGWLGWLAALRLGLAGPAIVGPMILSAIVHGAGWSAAHVPREAMILAQVSLGILLGNQFRGLTIEEFRSTMLWGVAFAIVLIASTIVLTEAMSRMFAFPYAPALLAYAPGGQAEMNLLAYGLDLDVAFVALHHLVRLAICMIGVQWWLRRLP